LRNSVTGMTATWRGALKREACHAHCLGRAEEDGRFERECAGRQQGDCVSKEADCQRGDAPEP
jgi:hypothetical protein